MLDYNNLLRFIKFLVVGPFPDGSLGGLAMNLSLTLICMLTGFFLGLCIALGRLSKRKIIKSLCFGFVEAVRSTPLLLIIFWFYFFIPNVLGKSISIFFSSIISLTVYSAAYQAEIFRGGFQSIPHGQVQGAMATGLNYLQVVMFILTPQTIKIMLPSFISFFISLFKDTSVTYIIGIIELTQTGVIISQRTPEKLFLSYACVGSLFFIFCYLLSIYARKLEKRMKKYRFS